MGIDIFDPRIGGDLSLDTTEFAFAKTGTGLDDIVTQILRDPGLNQRVDPAEMIEGASAAAAMNAILIEGIKATGIANSGSFQASDIYVLSDWVSANYLEELREYHGNDEGNVETGYHLVQGDGAKLYAFGDNIANTIGDGFYHIGLGIKHGRLINEDGNGNARLEKIAYWMNEVLADDLANGSLENASIEQYVAPTTGTGLDAAIGIVQSDPGLSRKISLDDINGASEAANTINALIVDGIKTLGLANDSALDAADIRALSEWIGANHYEVFKAAHGNDEDGIETGFHLAQNDGSETRLFGDNAVNTVLDGIYHIGFDIEHGRLRNEDGDANASLRSVAFWLSEFLHGDLQDGSLFNDAVEVAPEGTTGTALDEVVDLLVNDEALRRDFSTLEMAELGRDADALNSIFVEAVEATGVANDGSFSETDLAVASAWIRDNRSAEWSDLRGNYETDEGIAGLRWEGASARFAEVNLVDRFMAELYGLGYDHKWGGIRDADGKWLGRLDDLAIRLNYVLADDLASGNLANSDPATLDPSSFAGSQVVSFAGSIEDATRDDYVRIEHTADLALSAGTLSLSFRADDLSNGQTIIAKDANGKNEDDFSLYLYDGKLWVRTVMDGSTRYTDFPVVIEAGQDYDVAITFGEAGLGLWMNGEQVYYNRDLAFDLVSNQNDIVLGLTNSGQTVAGEGWLGSQLDGTVSNVAVYDRVLERAEIAGLSSSDAPVEVIYDHERLTITPANEDWNIPVTGTGLDVLVDAVIADPGLRRWTDTEDIRAGAEAAAGMNEIIIEAIVATGSTNDGEIDIHDIHRINEWIAENRLDEFRVLHGNDENGVETGYHLVQGDGGTSVMFGRKTVNNVADSIYHLGFGIDCQRLTNEDGDRNEAIEKVAYWLNALLADDMTKLANADVVVQPYAKTGTGLDDLVALMADDQGLDRKVSADDLDEGISAAGFMNVMVVDAITATGVANDGMLDASDMALVSDYIQENDKDAWVEAHGDDENNIETGFHLIQGDGGEERLYGEAAVNTVADSIYHLGFGYKNGYLVNEDGNFNRSLEKVGFWLDDLLRDDLEAGTLANANVSLEVSGTTGTGLDALVTMVMEAKGLQGKLNTAEIAEFATHVAGMTEILHDGIVATGIAANGEFTEEEMVTLDAWVAANALNEMRALNEQRLAVIEADKLWSAATPLFGEYGLAQVVDRLFEFGNGTRWGNSLMDQNGKWAGNLEEMASWLETLWATTPLPSTGDPVVIVDPEPEPEPEVVPDPEPEVEPEVVYATTQIGTDAEDPFKGTSGNDFLDGKGGRDNIYGGAGDDYIIAGAGNDWFVLGGTGKDIFQFGLGDGDVKIHDFEVGLDRIKLEDGLGFDDLGSGTITYGDVSTLILRTDENDRLMLVNVELSQLSETDFVV